MPFYRSKPLENFNELLELYATEDRTQIPINLTFERAKDKIDELCSGEHSDGYVISVEGSWGAGKTSFVKVLQKSISADLNVSHIFFDSLYYGNPSEATNVFLESIFETIKNDFGINVREGLKIARNITPDFEVSNGIPKFTLKYNHSRKSTESILDENVRSKLKELQGRLVVVIDDIDRLPPEDAIHFLRIVRVLKELPNLIIILPIDRLNLEALIRAQNITKPKAYLQKIIDESYKIDPEQASARILFERLLQKKYSGTGLINAENTEFLWNLLLWEISLVVIRQYEQDGAMRFTMGAGSADPNQWNLLDPISLPNGDNLVRKFIEQTSSEYGGSNYLVNVAEKNNPQHAFYRHYKMICSSASFTDFVKGSYIKNIQPQTESVNFGPTMMDFVWWDSSYLTSVSPESGDQNQLVYRIPQEESQKVQLFENINRGRRTMWDDFASLAGQFLPPQVKQFLSARTLNRIVHNLEIDFTLMQGTERAGMQVKMRELISDEIDFVRD